MTAFERGAEEGGMAIAAPLISSRANPAIKWIRTLRERRRRERTGMVFLESFRLVAEAVSQGAEIVALVFTPEVLARPFTRELVATQRSRGVRCLPVTPAVFAGLSERDGPEGIGAVVRQRWQRLSDIPLDGTLCWVALDAVQHPGNVGTVLRVCDAVGAGGLLLLEHTTDPYDPIAVRASMGAVLSRGLVRTGFSEFASWARRQGVTVVGTSPGAELDYRELPYAAPLVVLMGPEHGGLSLEHQTACDLMVRIPMVGRCDSLNVAVAASIVLYELFDRRERMGLTPPAGSRRSG